MATITHPQPVSGGITIEVLERRKPRPVVWWGALGAAFLALQAYVYTAWLVSGDAKSVAPGPDRVPTIMHLNARFHEVGSLVAMVLCIYFIVYKRWRRQGHITFDGMALLAGLTLYWQDPLANYFQPFYNYGALFTNRGSWACWIPGWQSPNGCRLPEPFAWSGMWYGYVVFGGVVFTCVAMRKARERWPRMGIMGTIGVALATLIVVDVIAETFWISLGMYHFGSAASGWTIFKGHYFQFPIYESFAVAAWITAYACLRFFKNDRGESFAERGATELRVSTKKQYLLRFLAIVGFYNLAFLCLYNVPAMMYGLKAGEWPQDIQKRSYLTNGLCGGDTGLACPGPSVPVPRTGRGIHLDPEGKLVVPPGADLPGAGRAGSGRDRG